MRILTNEDREEALKEPGREYEELSAQLQRWQLQNPTAVIARSPFARELIQEMVLVAERVLCLEGSTPEEIERFLEILLAQLDDPPKPPGLPARPTLPQGGPFRFPTLNTSSLLIFQANRTYCHTSHTPCDSQALS